MQLIYNSMYLKKITQLSTFKNQNVLRKGQANLKKGIKTASESKDNKDII